MWTGPAGVIRSQRRDPFVHTITPGGIPGTTLSLSCEGSYVSQIVGQ